MSSRPIALLLSVGILQCIGSAAVPTTKLYPFPGVDLQDIRTISKAELMPPSPELKEAWQVYSELRGSWMPGAPKPAAEAIARLDQLKGRLEALQEPDWFSNALKSPPTKPAQIAVKVGDAIFEKQKDTLEFQMLKARAIVYLTEHELDRPGAARSAGRFLAILDVAHPWDWELHALYSRLLTDVGRAAPGWHAALLSIFLNPVPSLGDLKFFAYVGSQAARDQWPEIQEAMRQAAAERSVADKAIAESDSLYHGEIDPKIGPRK